MNVMGMRAATAVARDLFEKYTRMRANTTISPAKRKEAVDVVLFWG